MSFRAAVTPWTPTSAVTTGLVMPVAARTMASAEPLVGALRKLSEKNLSNLTPHPWYSAWHYSHPTLTERESALNQLNLTTR